MKDVTLGVITEQGDLGLGFNQVTKEEQKVVQENDNNKNAENNKDKK